MAAEKSKHSGLSHSQNGRAQRIAANGHAGLNGQADRRKQVDLRAELVKLRRDVVSNHALTLGRIDYLIKASLAAPSS